MNEELQKALAALLGKANSGIDTASDFLASELPEVIQQLLLWHGVMSVVLFGLGLLILISIPKTFSMLKDFIPTKPSEVDKEGNWFYDHYYSGSASVGGGGIVYCMLVGFGFIALLIFALSSINIQWLQIWLAPKVWLIEYAAKLAS